jgi:hypothetical protein
VKDRWAGNSITQRDTEISSVLPIVSITIAASTEGGKALIDELCELCKLSLPVWAPPVFLFVVNTRASTVRSCLVLRAVRVTVVFQVSPVSVCVNCFSTVLNGITSVSISSLSSNG